MGVPACGHHPEVAAAWWCQGCDGFWCTDCVPAGEAKPHCPRCNSRMVPLEVPASHAPATSPPGHARGAPAPRTRSFYAALPEAMVYPFRGPGLYIIMGWIVLAAVQAFLAYLPAFGIVILFIRFLLMMTVAGYLCAYMLKLIVSSASGEKAPPDWPDFGNFWDDILHPMFLVIGTTAVAFLPATAYLGANANVSLEQFAFTGSLHLLIALFALGALYLPMALLGVAMHDSLRGLNPLRIVLAMARVFFPYAVTCALMVLVVLGVSAVHLLPQIPVVSFVLSAGVFMYLVMVEMRLIGLLYYSHRFRLNWFDELTDRYAARAAEE
jgi:hypothetical protein